MTGRAQRLIEDYAKHERVLLVAPDSKIPNLALMKLSAHHKERGDEVGWRMDEPSIVYVSIIRTKNRHLAEQIRWLYPESDIKIGGPGYDPRTRLPLEVERCRPDHTIYPDCRESIGRVTSGCIRRCPFCVVPQLEPQGIRYIQPPQDIWRPGTTLRLFDDNILAMPTAFEEVCGFCKKNDAQVRFEYLDARLMTPRFASMLAELRHERGIYISWDYTNLEPQVRACVEMLQAAGFRGGDDIKIFMYCHDEAGLPDLEYRWLKAREIGCVPFPMFNDENGVSARLSRTRRRVIRAPIWGALEKREGGMDELFRDQRRHLKSEEMF